MDDVISERKKNVCIFLHICLRLFLELRNSVIFPIFILILYIFVCNSIHRSGNTKSKKNFKNLEIKIAWKNKINKNKFI